MPAHKLDRAATHIVHSHPLTTATRPHPTSTDIRNKMATPPLAASGERDGMEQGPVVRLKLSYRGQTFRRSVDAGAFTWAAFLRWCVCTFSLCVKLCVQAERQRQDEEEEEAAVAHKETQPPPPTPPRRHTRSYMSRITTHISTHTIRGLECSLYLSHIHTTITIHIPSTGAWSASPPSRARRR